MTENGINTYTTERLKAVIMVGRPDFGRCSIATRLNRALWPLAGKPVLQRLLEHISSQGIRKFVICGSEDLCQIRERLEIPLYMDVTFRQERLPRGSAGCIYDAANREEDDLIFVLPATMTSPPDLHKLMEEHRNHNSPITIFFNPPSESGQESANEAQIYICESGILEHIPEAGYCDLKEGLLPKLIRADIPVAAGDLSDHTGSYTNWNEYISAVGDFLVSVSSEQRILKGYSKHPEYPSVYIQNNVTIHPASRIAGPVIIGSNSVLGSDVVVCGPSLIESNVIVESESVLCECALWPNVRIKPGCSLQNCLIDTNRVVLKKTRASQKLFFTPDSFLWKLTNSFRRMKLSSLLPKSQTTVSFRNLISQESRTFSLIGFLLVLAALFVSYLKPTLIDLIDTWSRSDEYSSGMLVPLLAGYILWHRKKEWIDAPIKPMISAVILLLAAQGIRFFGLFYYYGTLDRYSLLLTVAALYLLILGLSSFKKFFTIWLFLFLMFPLPAQVEGIITMPLQNWATGSAVYFLETLGYNVIQEGNVININGTLVAVAEACNGLRMLTAFFVVSGFVVLLTKRNLWQKIVILISSVPIALLCNTLRLTVTSIAFTILDTELWEQRFHDFGGLAMMPLALFITMIELWFLSRLFFNDPEQAKSLIVYKKREDIPINSGFSGK